MNHFWKRCLAGSLALAAALLAAGCDLLPGRTDADAAQPTPVVIKASTHENIRFADMAFAVPDTDAITARIDALYARIDEGAPVEQLVTEFRDIQEAYARACSMRELAYVHYAMDVTDAAWQTAYLSLSSRLTALDFDLADLAIALFQSSDAAESAARAAFGDSYVDGVYSDEAMNTDAIEDDLAAEQALIQQYDVLQSTFTYAFQGHDWTIDDIIQDTTLDSNAFYQLYDAYYAAFNSAAGSVFVEQLAVRHRIAQKLGYGSYAAYRYDLYGRDYTVTDAKALQAAVKRYIVPVYIDANNGENDAQLTLYGMRFDETAFFTAFGAAVTDLAPESGEAYAYMMRNGLIDTAVSDKKMDSNFTTYLSASDAPFTLMQWQGDWQSTGTVMHEFGHYLNYYVNPPKSWADSDSLDLAEIDSQAMQLLLTKYFGSFYGDLAGAAEKSLLLDCMYAMITGCLEDEFQQEVYAHPSWTLPEINACYRQLADEYGLTELYGYTGAEWTQILHTFQTPMYYISYAVSMVPALEIYAMSKEDHSAAEAVYFHIMNRAPYASFRTVVSENGLSDVFDENTIKRIADMLAASF